MMHWSITALIWAGSWALLCATQAAHAQRDLDDGSRNNRRLSHMPVQLGPRPYFLVEDVSMPLEGFTQESYAQAMIDEYKAARVDPRDVFPQSFYIEDVRYWITHEPRFGRQAIYLDDATTPADLPGAAELAAYNAEGINIVGPPTFALLALDADNGIVPSEYARNANAAGLEIVTWTLERSGILAGGNNGFYYQTIDAAVAREGDLMRVIDVLARDVGVLGIFSDWPASVSFYAGCMRLK